jgi:hypothetical protein
MSRIFHNAIKLPRAKHIVGLVALLLATAGCQQTRLIFNVPQATAPPVVAPRDSHKSGYRLAGYAPNEDVVTADNDDGLTQPAGATPPATSNESAALNDASSNGAPAIAYTAPAFALVPLITASGQSEGVGAASDANVARIGSEALVRGTGGIVGRAGLTGATPTVGGTLSSRPGLNEGLGLGLGYANPTNNIFTRQANPLSGPNGRCAELTRAGFFGGNRPACENPARR